MTQLLYRELVLLPGTDDRYTTGPPSPQTEASWRTDGWMDWRMLGGWRDRRTEGGRGGAVCGILYSGHPWRIWPCSDPLPFPANTLRWFQLLYWDCPTVISKAVKIIRKYQDCMHVRSVVVWTNSEVVIIWIRVYTLLASHYRGHHTIEAGLYWSTQMLTKMGNVNKDA